MEWTLILAATMAVFLATYLSMALLKPEWFS